MSCHLLSYSMFSHSSMDHGCSSSGKSLCHICHPSNKIRSYEHNNLFRQLFGRPMDHITEYEQREIDYVIALSLSEENLHNFTIEKEERMMKGQIDEDEQIAKALQETLIMASSTNNSNLTSKTYPFPDASRMCGGCNREISSRGHEHDVIDCNGVAWHEECLICKSCSQVITDDELYMSENCPYHISCHGKKRHHLKCDVCNNFEGIEYGEHPFWGQRYCPSHENDGTSKCCSCERLESNGKKHIPLKDGRKLCSECYKLAIMDTDECQILFREIREFFESLHMTVNQQFPLLLVEREALNEAIEEGKHGHHHLSETRGICLSEENMIMRRLKMGRGHGIFHTLTGPCKPVRTCEVTAILILYGLPRLLTGSILAHEMMHAWLRLNRYPSLKPEIEEGICQVIAYMWLKSELNSRSSNGVATSSSSSSLRSRHSDKHKLTETEKKLGECFIRQIELDASSAYGDGFRVGHQAVSQHGLRATLDHIKLAATFPITTFIS